MRAVCLWGRNFAVIGKVARPSEYVVCYLYILLIIPGVCMFLTFASQRRGPELCVFPVSSATRALMRATRDSMASAMVRSPGI